MIVQHHDLSAELLRFGGVEPPEPIDGVPFFEEALAGKEIRDHATVGSGATLSVATKRWFLNCKIDGTRPLLRDLEADSPFQTSVADDNPDVVQELFQAALKDAGGQFPERLLAISR